MIRLAEFFPQEIAKQIVNQGADYVLSLKENQPTLYQDVVSIFQKAEQCKYKNMQHKQKLEKIKGHGRVEKRRYTLITPREQQLFGLRWPHLRGLGMVEVSRRSTVTNEIENSTRFFLTSLDDGYELCLMSDLPQGTLPEKGKMYVEKKGEELRCLVQDPNGNTVDFLLNIKIADLKLIAPHMQIY
jgi:hypothetical protein